MSEQDLIGKAQAVLGEGDTIVAAAWFEPRGTSAGLVGGSVAGRGIGRAFGGGLGGAIGDLAGAAIAMETAKHTSGFGVGRGDDTSVHQVPWRSMVAVSDSRIYGWQIKEKGFHQVLGDQLFAIDRADVRVDVHARAAVHVFEVHDARTNESWEFEAGRMDSHLKYLIQQLHAVDATADS